MKLLLFQNIFWRPQVSSAQVQGSGTVGTEFVVIWGWG